MPGLGQDAPGRQRGAAQVHPGSQIHAAGAQRHAAPSTAHFPTKLCRPAEPQGRRRGRDGSRVWGTVAPSRTSQQLPGCDTAPTTPGEQHLLTNKHRPALLNHWLALAQDEAGQ